jgi:hypothetical protein
MAGMRPPRERAPTVRLAKTWGPALLAAWLVLLGAGSPAGAGPGFLDEPANLFEVLDEGDGICSYPGDPDCVKGSTVRRTRRIRLRTELLLGLEPGAVHLVRFNLVPGVNPTGWVAAGEKVQHGFVQWQAALDGDPLAWVGIFASPVAPMMWAAAPAPAPSVAIHEVAARAPDEPLGPGSDGPAPKAPTSQQPSPGIAHPTPPTGRSFLVSISSPRYGSYQVRGALGPLGTSSVGVVTQMDYSGLLACGLGDDPSKRGHGRCCRCCCRGGGGRGGSHGAGDPEASGGSTHLGPVGEPGNVTPTEVTLLLLCTEEALEVVKGLISEPDTPEGAMDVTLMDSVARTNLALQRSGTGVTISWVKPGTTWVSPYAKVWDQTMPEIQKALRDPTNPDFRRVHALRDDLGADLVSLVVGKRNAKVCGWGDIYDVGGTDEENAGNAFSVVRFECLGDHSLTHEVAHAFGCCHDRGDTALPCAWPYYRYAHWYQDYRGVEWSTVMGVLGGKRVLGYSNPDLTFNATPDLDPRHVSFGRDDANNARMIREYAPKVATYR